MRVALGAALLASTAVGFGGAVLAAGGVTGDAAATPATSSSGAPAFARGIVRLIAENRYGQAWTRLHPSHQRSAAYADYVRCERLSPIPGRLVSVVAGRAAEESVSLPSGRIVASKAVPVEIILRDLATRESTYVATTVHAVPFAGGWRWILPQARLDAYAAGQCPGVGGPPT